MPSYATAFGAAPFTGREADRIGLSRDPLRMLVATGQVRRVLRGVYVDAVVPDSLELRARAAAKVVPPGTVVCGRTAAWLWGIDTLAMGSHRVLPAVDVMAPGGRSAARRSGAFGCTGPLPDEDLVLLAGVVVTTPARTAADLARLLRRPDALASLDAMLRLPDLDREDVQSVLDRFGRHRGVVQARELLELADPRAESPQESRTRLRCVDAGFPCPEPQIEVLDAFGLFVARLDMGWRELCKAVEFDGDEHHSARADQLRDRDRRHRAERQGWGIAVVTSEHVLGQGMAFEHGVAELLGQESRLTRNHPRFGGWDPRSRWAA
jgi:hypothetical protein